MSFRFVKRSRFALKREVGIQVAIRLLRRGDLLDRPHPVLPQASRQDASQATRRPPPPICTHRVVEVDALKRAVDLAGRAPEIVDAARVSQCPNCDGRVTSRLIPIRGCPEGILQAHRINRRRPQPNIQTFRQINRASNHNKPPSRFTLIFLRCLPPFAGSRREREGHR